MSHPNPSHDRGNEYPDDGYKPHKRVHPRPLSSVIHRKGGSSQLSNVVQGWKHSMMSPHQKALDKAVRRHSEKKGK